MSKLISDLRKAYVDVLAKHGKLYHFDDDPVDIVGRDGKPCFTHTEAAVVRSVSTALHAEELFQLALKKIPCINCGSTTDHSECGGNEDDCPF